jgi:hypothetical protein
MTRRVVTGSMVGKSGLSDALLRSPLLACWMLPRGSARPRPPERRGAAYAAPGTVGGGNSLAGGDDLRRVVRRAAWRPRAVLRGLWARLRAAWREWSE